MADYPGLVKLVLTARSENSVRNSVIYYDSTTGHDWTDAELLTLASNWWASTGAAWKAATSTGVNFESVTVTNLSDETSQNQQVYQIPQPAPGLLTGDMLPANAACCVSWKTGFANRKRRGRTYLYGMNEAMSGGSVWSASYLALAGNVALAVLGFFNSVGLPVRHVILSRVGEFVTIVTAYLIDNIVDSQRRRLPNRGA